MRNMSRRGLLCGLVAGAMLVTAVALPQEPPPIKVTRLTETLYQLTTDQGEYTTNTIASVGKDGVLLVDTQSRTDAEALREVVDGFGKGTPKIIINTHRHVEHVGGNEIFGDEPIVIAHDLVRTKLRSGSYLFDEFPDATLPDITLTDRLAVYFNGERIELVAMPGSHDDNEVIVHFTASKVVHLSSLTNGFNFPSVDSDGDALQFAALVAKAIDLLPKDVVIVSGHNRNGTVDDLRTYHDMLVSTTDAIRAGLTAGKDADTLKAEKTLDPWRSYAGSYVSVDEWTDTLVAALQEDEDDDKKSVHEPLYYALKDGGVDAAVALYLDLKHEHADEYLFPDTDLMVIGNKLLTHGRVEPAVRFLELSLEQYPESDYAYYANYKLAVAHDQLGHRENALAYCKTASEQRPESEAIATLLEKLSAGG